MLKSGKATKPINVSREAAEWIDEFKSTQLHKDWCNTLGYRTGKPPTCSDWDAREGDCTTSCQSAVDHILHAYCKMVEMFKGKVPIAEWDNPWWIYMYDDINGFYQWDLRDFEPETRPRITGRLPKFDFSDMRMGEVRVLPYDGDSVESMIQCKLRAQKRAGIKTEFVKEDGTRTSVSGAIDRHEDGKTYLRFRRCG